MTDGQNTAGGQKQTGVAGQHHSNPQGGLNGQAKRAGDQLADAAQQSKDQAAKTVSALASEAGERVQSYLDQQVVAGADLVEGVSKAMRAAADELAPTLPILASAARSAADNVQNICRNIRNKNADELLSDARDMVRRKPALVFSAAAGLGFLAFRILNAGDTQRRSTSQNMTPLQPSHHTDSFGSTRRAGPTYGSTESFGSTGQAGRTYGGTQSFEPTGQAGRIDGR
jgi:hypothetical protein